MHLFPVDHPQLPSKIYIENRIWLSSDHFILCYASAQRVLGVLLEKNLYVLSERHRQLKTQEKLVLYINGVPFVSYLESCYCYF